LLASSGVSFRNLAVLSAAVLALPALAAAAGPETTTPGVIYVIKTTINDKHVVLARDRFNTARLTRNGIYRYPRGAQLRFAITNKGTRPYSLKMWETTSPVIRPGRRDAMFINWQFRGKYRYAVLYRGKPAGPKGYIVIF
jgi:hypothetical protein